MQTRTPLLIALIAAAALGGCKKQSHTIVVGPHADEASPSAPAAPVALPPTVSSSKVYRCADNKVVYVDWLSDGKSANVRTDKTGAATQLTTPEAGKPMAAAGGYELSGAPGASSVRIAVPGHGSQSCKS